MNTNITHSSDNTVSLKRINSERKAIIHFMGVLILLIVCGLSTAKAQQMERKAPIWWWGGSLAANINFYGGTTQFLNPSVISFLPFHKGTGIAPYVSVLGEYRRNKLWGIMLNLSFDDRGGAFKHLTSPSGKNIELGHTLSYLSIEPSFKIMLFKQGFFLFMGPEANFNIMKKFKLEIQEGDKIKSNFSNVRPAMFSGQIGAGYDIDVTPKSKKIWVELSPFISYQTFFGRDVRTIEDFDVSTLRIGVAVKFGKSKEIINPVGENVPVEVLPIPQKEVMFSVNSPGIVRIKRNVKETFPVRNYVFFDKNETTISKRYVLLNKNEAPGFNEDQLLNKGPKNISGPMAQKLIIYYNVLNIVGERMKKYPAATITLIGSNSKGAKEGELMAKSVRNYLVNTFDIDSARIMTKGRIKPLIPTETEEYKLYMDEQLAEDNRVDIVSNSADLLMEAGTNDSTLMHPVELVTIQEDPLDNKVMFYADYASEVLNWWKVDITDQNGKMQHYGPYKQDQVSISGETILGDNTQGNYKIVMTGQKTDGTEMKKEATMSLVRKDENITGLRFSILFDFDKYVTVETYRVFLANIVAPLIPDGAKVIVHGHTDIIGMTEHNKKLSEKRAAEAQDILSKATQMEGKNNVEYNAYSYGADEQQAPFSNKLPEERCYNRTVIIDIIPNK